MAYDTLHDRLRGPVALALKKELKQENVNALPRIEKVVVSTGLNKSKMDSKEIHAYVAESLTLITGQKPVFTKTRKAISNFKTREGMVVGAKITLRGKHMEAFLDRLLSYALPRIRDFRGVTTKLDGHGNFAIGLNDHSIFPEVPAPEANQIFGLEIQITTTTQSDDEARALLKQMGMPFRVDQKKEDDAANVKAAAEKKVAEEVAKEEAAAEKEAESESEEKSTEDEKDAKNVESETKKPDTSNPES